MIGQAINMTAKNVVMRQRPMKQFNIAEAKSKFSEWVDAAAQSDDSIIPKAGTLYCFHRIRAGTRRSGRAA
jgi:hypothetical protein